MRHEWFSILSQIKDALATDDIQAYLVGGFVRQLLLNQEAADIDIAVAARGLDVARKVAQYLGGRFVPLDEARDTARVVLPPGITTGRAVSFSIDFTGMVEGLEKELARRDFTMNAMAIPLDSLEEHLLAFTIVDPLGGRQDLEDRRIRAVSSGVFTEDPARLLRAVRLAAELKFEIEEGTERLIQANAGLISRVAGERVREELLRLLKVHEIFGVLRYLDHLGLLLAIFPELAPSKGVEQPREHHWDVFNHSLETVAAIGYLMGEQKWPHVKEEMLPPVPWSNDIEAYFNEDVGGSSRKTLLKLAALLHDVAKPWTKGPDEKGKIRFLGHATEGAKVAGQALERLRFSSREKDLVQTMVLHHLRPGQMASDGLPTRRAIYRYFRDTADAGIAILYLSLADHLATRGEGLDLQGWRNNVTMVEFVLGERKKEAAVVSPPKLLDGHDIMGMFHLPPGPEIGTLLEAVREAQAAGEIHTREEAMAFVEKQLSSTTRRKK